MRAECHPRKCDFPIFSGPVITPRVRCEDYAMSTLNPTRPWTATSAMPTLSVLDLEEAVHFYEVLGFQEKWRFPDADRAPAGAAPRWTHACLQLGQVCVLLALHDPADGPVPPQSVYLFLRDVGEYYSHLRLLLGDELEEIGDKHYGMRDFCLTDPWGHSLTFGEPLRASTEVR